MKKITLFIALFTISTFSLYAQYELESLKIEMSKEQKNSLNQLFSDSEVFQINLKNLNEIVSSSKETQLNWKINSKLQFAMSIHNKDIRSFRYQETFSGSNGSRESKTRGKSNTYRGQTNDGKFVRLTITNDFIYGIIETKSGLMIIDQLSYVLNDKNIPSNQLIMYKNEHLRETNGFCETDNGILKKIESQSKITQKVATSCMILEVATDADFEYFQEYGNNSNTRILAEFNNIQGVYNATLDLQVVIVHQNVWTTVNDPYTSVIPATINNEISTAWQTTFGNIKRDLVHMFTGKDLGTLLGRASGLGDVCSNTNANSYTVDRVDAFRTLGHEIGHNLGGIHGDGVQCGTANASVMCQGIKQIPIYFSNNSVTRITNYMNANSACLLDFENISSFISGSDFICNNNNHIYSLNVPVGAIVTWSLNNNNATIISGQGTSSVTIKKQNNGNVRLTASINFVCPTPSIISKDIWIGTPNTPSYIFEANHNTSFCKNTNYLFEAIIPQGANPFGFVWFVSGSGGTQFYPQHTSHTLPITFTSSGNYTVGVRASNGCSLSNPTFLNVTVGNCGGWFFTVSPNPSSSEIFVTEKKETESVKNIINQASKEKTTLDNISLKLYDFSGNLVEQKKFNKRSFAPKLDVSSLKKGTYFLRIIAKEVDEVHQIIVE